MNAEEKAREINLLHSGLSTNFLLNACCVHGPVIISKSNNRV